MKILSYQSKNFPSVPPKANGTVHISSAKLCWAAITVGRPGKAAVRSFGTYSKYEALFRWNMVRAAIRIDGPLEHFQNTDLFNALDPTEKGGVNFYLGMIFAKIAAQDLLGIPWLIHFHWMTKNHSIPLTKGQSSPDLLGLSPATGNWSVFEAKGKVGGYSSKLMEKAKSQASNLTIVDGVSCERYVGTQLYRNSSKQLKFAWEDPEPDDRMPWELETNREMWRRYYAVAYAIYEAQSREPESVGQLGFKVGFAPAALDFIAAVNNPDRPFTEELAGLLELSRTVAKEADTDTQLDGIILSKPDLTEPDSDEVILG